jgi:hypothetical protein
MNSEYGYPPPSWNPPPTEQPPPYAGPGYPSPYGPPGYGPPGYGPPRYGPPPFSPQDPPDLPSRTATVLVTAFFGLFGLIPASMHSKRAKQLGVSGNRYFTAFGITFGATSLAWACIGAAVFLMAPDTSDPAESLSASEQSEPGEKDRGGGRPPEVDGEWTVETLQPVLEGFADDQWLEEAAFDTTWGALVPCGGPWQQGMAPDVVQTTGGGNFYLASAQILPGAAAAERELARQVALLQGCATGYEIYDLGELMGTCTPTVDALTPAVRYVEDCDDGTAYAFAIFQADNAVVTVSAPDEVAMDRKLADLMSELDAD